MDKKTQCAQCDMREMNLICSHPQMIEEIDKIKVESDFKNHETIFRTGEMPLGIFSIQSGLVKLETISENGTAHTLRFIGAGGVLGYRSLFANEPYHATAVAVEKTRLCFIPKIQLMQLFHKHPDVTLKLLCHLSKDLRTAETKWTDQIDKGAPERIAEALLFLTDHFDHDHWTRKEIAQWAGTTTETVIRTLAQFEKEGIIDQTGREIHILSRDILKNKAKEILK